jgi:hypothetical protein
VTGATNTKLGRLDGFSLSNILQILAMEGLTCTVIVGRGMDRADLFMVDGILIHASALGLTGREAAMAVLLWEGVSVEIAEQCPTGQRTVDEPVSALLLEAARLADEARNQTMQAKDEVVGESARRENHGQRGTHAANSNRKRRTSVNAKQLNEAITVFKNEVGEGLMGMDVWERTDGVSLAGFNSNPAATAVFNRMADMVTTTLADSQFPPLNRYFLLDLEANKLAIVVPAGDFRAGMLVDTEKVALGIILSVAVPKFRAALEKAIAS